MTTHYPREDAPTYAICGARLSFRSRRISGSPTCPVCARMLAERQAEDTATATALEKEFGR